MGKYKKLKEYLRKVTDLEYLANLTLWEMRISGASDSKNYLIDVRTRLEGEKFELITSDTYGKLLLDLINSFEMKDLSDVEQNYITNLFIRYNNFKKIPSDFYKEYVKNNQITTKIWEEAKKTNNYELFKPYLKKNIEMAKKYYRYIDSEHDLYDVMVNEYERSMTSEVLDGLFDRLKEYLVPLIRKIETLKKEYKIEYTDQELLEVAGYLLNYMGFDMKRGVIGIYPHGFTEKLNANDVRIAFKNTSDPISFVKTVIHEGGHGIFEQNINSNLSIFSNGCIENLYALHESQSRFYENILGRNKNFWIPIYDDIKKMLKLDIEIDEFIELLNTIKAGTIRVNADELTYALHIIIRYEIERDLFRDKVSIDDLPKIWNDKMKQYLGIVPRCDSEGLMQDIHWAEGHFGYFPSYLVGNIYDGMFINCIEKNLGSINELLRNGEINKITNFLINNIYQYGSAYNSCDIIKRMCGMDLSSEPIINYYEKKYMM